jgi:hypothetical protein
MKSKLKEKTAARFSLRNSHAQFSMTSPDSRPISSPRRRRPGSRALSLFTSPHISVFQGVFVAFSVSMVLIWAAPPPQPCSAATFPQCLPSGMQLRHTALYFFLSCMSLSRNGSPVIHVPRALLLLYATSKEWADSNSTAMEFGSTVLGT